MSMSCLRMRSSSRSSGQSYTWPSMTEKDDWLAPSLRGSAGGAADCAVALAVGAGWGFSAIGEKSTAGDRGPSTRSLRLLAQDDRLKTFFIQDDRLRIPLCLCVSVVKVAICPRSRSAPALRTHVKGW